MCAGGRSTERRLCKTYVPGLGWHTQHDIKGMFGSRYRDIPAISRFGGGWGWVRPVGLTRTPEKVLYPYGVSSPALTAPQIRGPSMAGRAPHAVKNMPNRVCQSFLFLIYY